MVRMQRDLGMGTLALLVTACMLFSVLSPAIVCWDDDVYADAGGSKPDFTYVSIGDSISNGYGMDGYYKEGDDINYRGFLQEVPQAYPSLIRDLLGEYYGYLVDVLNTLVREYCESAPLTLFVDISEAVDDTLADMDMLPFYTVTWKSYDGSVLSVQRVGDVEDARYNGPTPTRAMTDDIRYEWAGWSEPVMDSEGNMVLTAIFDEIPRKQYVEAEEGSDDVSFDIADIEREFIVAKNKGWDIQLPASLFTGSGTAKVSLKVLDKSALPDDVSDLAGDKKVISLDLSIDGEVISDFDVTGVTVSFEYVPTDGEDMSSIAVWYVNVNGKTLEKCDNARFDASSNRMVFDTTHFSYWVVGHVADDTPGHSIIDGYPLTVALVISILVLIGCVILVKVKR